MKGQYGVFSGAELLGEFGTDDDADEYRRDLLQEQLPEHLRMAEYDAGDLRVRPVPENYELWWALLDGLVRSRAQDRAADRLKRLGEEAACATA